MPPRTNEVMLKYRKKQQIINSCITASIEF